MKKTPVVDQFPFEIMGFIACRLSRDDGWEHLGSDLFSREWLQFGDIWDRVRFETHPNHNLQEFTAW